MYLFIYVVVVIIIVYLFVVIYYFFFAFISVPEVCVIFSFQGMKYVSRKSVKFQEIDYIGGNQLVSGIACFFFCPPLTDMM